MLALAVLVSEKCNELKQRNTRVAATPISILLSFCFGLSLILFYLLF
jgi:hypothetical protein